MGHIGTLQGKKGGDTITAGLQSPQTGKIFNPLQRSQRVVILCWIVSPQEGGAQDSQRKKAHKLRQGRAAE